MSRSPYIDEGLRLFDEGRYFLAHETLEEHWVEAPEGMRDFLQGLIHCAVAFHHLERNNKKGATLQFEKAKIRLSALPDRFEEVDVAGLREFLDSVPDLMARSAEVRPPKLG